MPDSGLNPGGNSLDPSDWNEFRGLCHGALDEAIDWLERVRERPVWRPIPDDVKRRLHEPAPRIGQGLARTLEQFRQLVMPYPTGNIHPRFFGWVHGAGQPSGMLAAIFSAAMNVNCGGREHAATYVERAVLDWCKEVFGFPPQATGVLVTGTSHATLLALAVARLARASSSLVAYASDQVHNAVPKALNLLGLGSASLHRIPSGPDFRIDTRALAEVVNRDRAAGLTPFCVIGTAGTVDTGATDDLSALAAFCRADGLWFHVDGAFGAWCAIHPDLCERVRGIELADSLAFDFHKWLHVEYATGCVLVREGRLLQDTFGSAPPYLETDECGLFGGRPWFHEFGTDLSRGFLALRVWFALKEHGFDRFGQLIAMDCEHAARLASLVSARAELELLAPPPLNIVCFRYRNTHRPEPELDRLNKLLAADLQESGVAAMSTTRIGGRLWLRASMTNHRTRTEDLELMIEELVKRAGHFISSGQVLNSI